MIAILGGLGAAVAWAISTLCSSRSSRMIEPTSVAAWIMLVGLVIAVPPAVLCIAFGRIVAGSWEKLPPAAALLPQRLAQHAGYDQPGTGDAEESATIHLRGKTTVREQLVALRFEQEIVESRLVHLLSPFILRAACWMAARMRG